MPRIYQGEERISLEKWGMMHDGEAELGMTAKGS